MIYIFCSNSCQQQSLFDSVNKLPKYLKQMLEKSWAHIFSKYIFPHINEKRFAVLYSDNPASRPNSPVNVIIGLLILKDIFQLTDEELIGSLYFDTRFQYALRTTGLEKQPVSINTLTNFRKRLYEYEKENQIDLIKDEVEEQAELIAKYLRIDHKQIRMDSFMFSSSCKRLSRIELVYSVNANLVKVLSQLAKDIIPEDCQAYLEAGHKNETIYKTRDTETNSKLDILLQQSQALYHASKNIGKTVTNTEEFKLLARMLTEQLDENTYGETENKPGKYIKPNSLQNPSDPDATYRNKYGPNTGYVANVVEDFNDTNSVISNYDLKPNIHSDSKFADEAIEKIIAKKQLNQDSNPTQLIVDGAFYAQDRAEEALTNDIELIPSEMVGKKPDPEKLSYEQFEIDEDTNTIKLCPFGKSPLYSYNKDKIYTAKFSKDECTNCPYNGQCPIKKQKKFNTIRFSEKKYHIDKQREKMSTAEYIKIANKRAGVEGIPSVMRRRYNIDHLPVRGLLRSKLWFGFKIAAYNLKKLFKVLLSLLNIFNPKFVLLFINICIRRFSSYLNSFTYAHIF